MDETYETCDLLWFHYTYHSPYHSLCLCQQFVFFGLKELVPEQWPSGNWIHQGVETMHQRRSVGRRVAAGLRNGRDVGTDFFWQLQKV